MLRAKGSLAGTTLNGKIYAIGGGNSMGGFSDVEMFDPMHGTWINCRSLISKVTIIISLCIIYAC